MYLGHEGTSRVHDAKLPTPRFRTNARGNSVRTKNQDRSPRDPFNGLNKDRASATQLVHDVAVMHDFMMNVNWISISFKGELDNVDGSDHAGAKSARANPYQRLGTVVGSMNRSQRQCNLRKAPSFYLKPCFPATSFAFLCFLQCNSRHKGEIRKG